MFWIWFFTVIGVLTLIDWLTYKYVKGVECRSGEIRVTEGFNIYRGHHNLAFHFEPEYDDERYMQLIIDTMWHSMFIHLPWWKVPEGANNQWENKSYRFGFYFYNTDAKKLFELIVVFWKNWDKTFYMPWSYECHHIIIEGKDGRRYIEFYKDYKKRRIRAEKYNCRPLPVTDIFDIYDKPTFYWEEPYEYTLNDGKVQRCIGMYHIEEREWRPRATYWLPIFKITRKDLEIKLTDEIGEKSGTWKGGCTGFGRAILPGEDPHTAYQRIMKESKF